MYLQKRFYAHMRYVSTKEETQMSNHYNIRNAVSDGEKNTPTLPLFRNNDKQVQLLQMQIQNLENPPPCFNARGDDVARHQSCFISISKINDLSLMQICKAFKYVRI